MNKARAFKFTPLSKRKAPVVTTNLANLATVAASDRRILENTASLRDIYAFIEESKKRVP
jgi:hypothetical protein